jgi:hypothetical protein
LNVPPFVPPPIEIPRNVTEERHVVRVAFVRRVVLWHAASAAVIAALVGLPLPAVSMTYSGAAVLILLVTLSLVRDVTKGRPQEQRVSIAIFPLLLVALGLFAHEASAQGLPVWSPLVGLACIVIYTVLCGRDLSFMGMYVLSLLVSTIVIATLVLRMHLDRTVAAQAMGLNILYVTYYVYDLAGLQTRRRLREEAGAVVDLYRDVLNIFGYSVRVVRHWQKHRIWSK